jgi:mono/diheme cytochrome c family protein
VRAKWLLIIVGPALAMLIGGVAAMLFFPYPVPKRATPAQALYLSNCATCHGSTGAGSWRATLFLMRPGNLSDPRLVNGLRDDYLFLLIKSGGAPLGKPGMPAFGYHLRDDEIRELIGYLRTLPKQ